MSAISYGIPYNLNLPGFLKVGGTLTAGNISTSPGNGVIPQAGSNGKIDVGFIPTTNLQITFRAGTDAERAVTVFAAGEPAYATDTKRMWLGDGSTLGGLSEFALPAQAGNNGKILTTDGSVSSWLDLSSIGYTYDGNDFVITLDAGGVTAVLNGDGLTVANGLIVNGNAAFNTSGGSLYVDGFISCTSPIRFGTYTVATLPSASSYSHGIVFVSDATQNASAGLGSTPTGGGSNVVPVFSNGTNWIIL